MSINTTVALDTKSYGFEPDVETLFSRFVNYPACAVVQKVPYADRCGFVRQSVECQRRKKFVNYTQMLYCVFSPSNDLEQVLCITFMVSLCVVFFLILGITVDRIFCPALKVIARTLGISEHIAGVTLVAFGNGSPDLFGSFIGVNEPGRIILSDLFGGAVFVTSFVSALIFMAYPFKLQATIIRDICFFILGVLYVDYAMVTDNYVTFFESILILLVYITYITVIILEQILLKRSLSNLETRISRGELRSAVHYKRLDDMRGEAGIEIISRVSRISINVNVTRRTTYNSSAPANKGLFKQFFSSLNPINIEEWRDGGILRKFYMICEVPWTLILLLVVPVVDYELDRHGWSKLLNSLQIMSVPAVLTAFIFQKYYFYGMPVFVYSFLITAPFSLIVFATTRTDLPPIYHPILAMFGSCISMMIIYICAGESVELLNVLGLTTYASNSFMGATFQAWGNSIGDMVSNFTLAKHGYPRMGMAACLGGPFLNSLLSIGGTFLYKTYRSKDKLEVVKQGSLGENCVIFLVATLTSMLIWAVVLNYNGRRSICFFNYGLYIIFFIYAVLGELELIQTFAPEKTSLFI